MVDGAALEIRSDFWKSNLENLRAEAAFREWQCAGNLNIFPAYLSKRFLAFYNFISGAVLKWSKRRDSKSRRTVRLPGFKSLLLRQTEGTGEF